MSRSSTRGNQEEPEDSRIAWAILDERGQLCAASDSLKDVLDLDRIEGLGIEEILEQGDACGSEIFDRPFSYTGSRGTTRTLRLHRPGLHAQPPTPGIPTGCDRGNVIIVEDCSSLVRLEDELLLAKNEAHYAREARREFISHISHELRTPLNGINGMAQLLEDTELDGEQKDLVETLRSSILSMNAIIQELIDFSRMETGKIRTNPAWFDLNRTIQAVISGNEEEAGHKGISLVYTPLETSFLYYGDEMLLLQVLNNLVSNGVKFTDKGSVSIQLENTGKLLQISICDTGIGIAPDKRKMIFESFARAEPGYLSQRQGLGLGLSIARQLTDLLEGTISVENGQSTGSCFILKLPAAERIKTAPATANRPRAGTETPGTTETGVEVSDSGAKKDDYLSGLRILVAEDDPLNQRTLNAFLTRQGCLVSLAGNGAEAEQKLRAMHFDLIILDVTMPEKNGMELAAMVKHGKFHGNRGTPVLGVTAYGFQEEIDSFIRAGMWDVLPKPFVARQLYRKIDTLLCRKKSLQ